MFWYKHSMIWMCLCLLLPVRRQHSLPRSIFISSSSSLTQVAPLYANITYDSSALHSFPTHSRSFEESLHFHNTTDESRPGRLCLSRKAFLVYHILRPRASQPREASG